MTENDRNDRNDRTAGNAAPGGPTPQAGGGATPPPYVPPTPPEGTPGPGTPPQGVRGHSPAPGQPGGQQPGQPGGQQPGGQPGQPGGKRGQIRQQQPGVTQARPPTLAEQRARTQALEQQREAELALEAEQARKRKQRKRLLIGGGVAVGVVGVVAIWYAASSPDDVEAQCTQDGVVVDDKYCDDSYARSHGGYTSGGFIYIGGSSYRYHYGGSSVPVGQKVSGGSYTIPKGANVTTKSGTTVQRGGFGVSGGSKSGGS
ncbi:type II secretory pathway pseudopilin PulG [Saccharothrix tamanrassetensis]|uniref:Type II secretory pathway pseudopilin PulG n=1 Tax=Saccharothrix tamanrassetensis TaxID=1051531 RepID=A0A841CMK4_9PSEU|nr:cell envelope integrity protein TolA [Saccharothrix tamanrassetensis]MBB5958841.1 type II secretory pathway pseudopilin PulG [Saccharothrix tamanrassetensis]